MDLDCCPNLVSCCACVCLCVCVLVCAVYSRTVAQVAQDFFHSLFDYYYYYNYYYYYYYYYYY